MSLDDIGMSTAFQIPETIPDTVVVLCLCCYGLQRASGWGDSPLNMGCAGPSGGRWLGGGCQNGSQEYRCYGLQGIVSYYIPACSYYGLEGITTAVFHALQSCRVGMFVVRKCTFESTVLRAVRCYE